MLSDAAACHAAGGGGGDGGAGGLGGGSTQLVCTHVAHGAPFGMNALQHALQTGGAHFPSASGWQFRGGGGAGGGDGGGGGGGDRHFSDTHCSHAGPSGMKALQHAAHTPGPHAPPAPG